MDFFAILTMIGGLALFLYGMQVLGDGLAKVSGGRMEIILEKLTASRFKAVLLGAVVTALIQSSSATTVMVVGFVNSGIMKLAQAIGIIMGANIGTTITSWVLSLSGIESSSFFVRLLKPSSFSPVLAWIGVTILLFSKKEKKKNIALILVGFAILMFGMDTMTNAVKPLADVPEFTRILIAFSNPLLGLIAGVFLTAVIQSSSASVGILQALCATGAVTYKTAVPIIMGQNIGTCITTLLSSIGASKNAKRAAVVHLYFNLIGTIAFMFLFYSLNYVFNFQFMKQSAEAYGIAALHSIFNLFATFLLLPFAEWLEKLACFTVRSGDSIKTEISLADKDKKILDDRFLHNPALAMEQCRNVVLHMAETTKETYMDSAGLLKHYDKKKAKAVCERQEDTSRYEEMIGTYLLKLRGKQLLEKDSQSMILFLECIGDFERISTHAAGIQKACEKMQEKKKGFSNKAKTELDILLSAVAHLLTIATEAFEKGDETCSGQAGSLLQVITELSAEIRKRHIKRLRKGKCTVEHGFLLNDIVTDCEGIAAHCSHIAVSVAEVQEEPLKTHEYMDELYQNETEDEKQLYKRFQKQYVLP